MNQFPPSVLISYCGVAASIIVAVAALVVAVRQPRQPLRGKILATILTLFNSAGFGYLLCALLTAIYVFLVPDPQNAPLAAKLFIVACYGIWFISTLLILLSSGFLTVLIWAKLSPSSTEAR